MKYTFLITAIFFISLVKAQSNFNRGYDTGYDTGYGEGYCYDRKIACIKPISPITPIPKIGEDFNNYQDGYNRGFNDGLAKQKSGLQNQQSSNDRQRFKTAPAVFIDDIIYDPYKDMDIVDLKMKAISSIVDTAIKNLKNGNYNDVIENGNNLIKLEPNLSIAYFFKSIAYYRKGEILNSYNYGNKQYRLYNSSNSKEWYDQIFEITKEYLTNQMVNRNYAEIQKFCENVWYKNELSNYFLGLAYYYQNDYKKAKKNFRKVKDFQPAKDYLKAIESNTIISNPYSNQTSNIVEKEIVYKKHPSYSKEFTGVQKVYPLSPINDKPSMGEGEKTIGQAVNNSVIILEQYNNKFYKVKSGDITGYLWVGWFVSF